MSLSVLVILLNWWWGIRCRPYKFFLRNHNVSGWLKGHPVGGFNIFISLSGKVAFQKKNHSPWWIRCWWSIAILVCWFRWEYEKNGSYLYFSFQEQSSRFPKTTIFLLYLCSFMSESCLTIRQNIGGMDMGAPSALIFFPLDRDEFPCFHVT